MRSRITPPKRPNVCNLCGGKVVLTPNEGIYGTSYGSGYVYFCTDCKAYVGTHKNNPQQAMGILADKKLRVKKQECHNSFDKLWKDNKKLRPALYNQLAKELDIHPSDCHFGYFDLFLLEKAQKIIYRWRKEGLPEEIQDMITYEGMTWRDMVD